MVLSGLKYAFRILSHPFDGFWCLKSEKRGNVKSAAILTIFFFITMVVRMYGTGYLFTKISMENFSVWALLMLMVAIILLYCVVNWAITMLADGKGTLKEIFLYVAYSLTPMILVNIPITILSNIFNLDQLAWYSFINTMAIVWTIFLLLVGNLSIHDYTMTKSFIIVLLTVVFMIVFAVLLVLFGNLIEGLYVLIMSIIREILYRI